MHTRISAIENNDIYIDTEKHSQYIGKWGKQVLKQYEGRKCVFFHHGK